MYDCRKDSQKVYLGALISRRARTRSTSGGAIPPPGIAVWPPTALQEDEPPTDTDLYFYRPGELLVPGAQAELFQQTADAIQVRFEPSSSSCVVHRPDGYERLENLEGTFLTGAARFTNVTFGGQFDPEGIIKALQEQAEKGGNNLNVTPNHVVFGCQNWLMEPCGDPSLPPQDEHVEGKPGGEGIVVAVIDSGLPEGYSANPLMAPLKIVDNLELEPFPYEGPMPGGVPVKYAQGHGAFVCGVVRQNAMGAQVWSYRALDTDGTTDEWSLGVQLGLALRDQRASYPQIINLSLGTLTRGNQSALGFTALGRVASKRDGSAPIVVAAAGNFGWARPFYPAYDRWTISVGAAERQTDHPDDVPEGWRRACFSDHGDPSFGCWVDVCARGVDVYSSYAKQNYQPSFPSGPQIAFDGWALWNGTSFATPHVTGRVAGILGDHRLRRHRPLRREVLHDLKKDAFRVENIGWLVR